MDRCFRFLINVDDCLNMSNFDIFFYKLQSQKYNNLRTSQVHFSEETGKYSLSQSVKDIRLHLNKYPYLTDEYQIIVTMRSAWQNERIWQNSLLYRILNINYALLQENINMNAGASQRALNLIMLYEADSGLVDNNLDRYMSSSRLKEDCSLMFEYLGIDRSQSFNLDAIKRVYKERLENSSSDVALKRLFETFIGSVSKKNDFEGEGTSKTDNVFMALFVSHISTELSNYKVMEMFVPRSLQHEPRENTIAMFRVIEFINMSLEHTDPNTLAPSLTERCQKNWDKVMAEKDIEKKYAHMLKRYGLTLQTAYEVLNGKNIPVMSTAPLPSIPTEREDEINCENDYFNSSSKEEQLTDLKGHLLRFKSNGLHVNNVQKEWSNTYSSLKARLNDMSGGLKKYADDLVSVYTKKIEERKRDSLVWERNVYFSDEYTEDHIKQLEERRNACLRELRDPQMDPSLCFQDQLNMENALEKKDKLIRKYSECLTCATFFSFLSLLITVMVIAVVHYTLLQPFVFKEYTQSIAYFCYIGCVFVLLSFSWGLPFFHFKRLIKKDIKELMVDIDTYVSGYYGKGSQFNRYINLLNILDFTTKYLKLYKEASNRSRKLARMRLWHTTKVKDHLEKLKFFEGLIERHSDEYNNDEGIKINLNDFFYSNGNRLRSVINVHVYWPQGQGDNL